MVIRRVRQFGMEGIRVLAVVVLCRVFVFSCCKPPLSVLSESVVVQ